MTMHELRLKTKLSQREFSRMYGIPLKTFQKWDQGVTEPPEYIVDLFTRLITEVDFKDCDKK